MPPEYYQEGHVSEKTDSYAFGVVLLELLTGLPAKDPKTRQPLALKMARVLDNPARNLPRTLDNLAAWDDNTALRVAEVARSCLEPYTHRRSAAADVRAQLDRLAGRARRGNHVTR